VCVCACVLREGGGGGRQKHALRDDLRVHLVGERCTQQRRLAVVTRAKNDNHGVVCGFVGLVSLLKCQTRAQLNAPQVNSRRICVNL
jgi:hypothetical protein